MKLTRCKVFASSIFLFFAFAMTSCGYKRQPVILDAGDKLPRDMQLAGYTPVKDQGKSELGWAYAMLATIESEHIMKGDSVNLSIAYIARKMLYEKALEYYFCQGQHPIGMIGMGATLIKYIGQYGAEPYDSYQDPKKVNYQVLCRKVERICDGAISKRVGVDKLAKTLDELFDKEIGYMPAKTVYMLGAEYTPMEFAHSVCYPEEYVSITSFAHHPFREYFALEVPNNQWGHLFLNLTIDEMMSHLREAVKRGHPVCWEGDISEPCFAKANNGYVDLPASKLPVTQASRQREFEQLRTTDDHAMEIVGCIQQGGKRYYVCKNSQGEDWGVQGFVFLSEDYIRLKTIAIYMSEKAFIYDKKP